MNISNRYVRALTRNLYECRSALSERNAINALVKVKPTTSWSFFSYAYLAFYNDMVAHSIKVLDKHKDAASFWYLYRCKKNEVLDFLDEIDLPLTEVDDLSEKLNHIRNKTHFHIDKKGVFNPEEIWKQADIKGNFFNKVMDGLWETLNHLYFLHHDKKFNQPLYTGKDVKDIIEAVHEAGIKV